MARVLVTGSNDGLGRDAARRLLEGGHAVVGHARSAAKADALHAQLPGLEDVLVADFSSLRQVRALAHAADASGGFDAVIHNAAVSEQGPRRLETEDGHAEVLAVNALAAYVLTARMARPQRLVYLSSDLHKRGRPDLRDLDWRDRPWDGLQAYSDSKLFVAALAAAIARRWPQVRSNSVTPGWVATKMGGPNATDDYEAGSTTQVWLAAGDDAATAPTGLHLFHQRERAAHPAVTDPAFQDALLRAFEQLTGDRID